MSKIIGGTLKKHENQIVQTCMDSLDGHILELFNDIGVICSKLSPDNETTRNVFFNSICYVLVQLIMNVVGNDNANGGDSTLETAWRFCADSISSNVALQMRTVRDGTAH